MLEAGRVCIADFVEARRNRLNRDNRLPDGRAGVGGDVDVSGEIGATELSISP